jgi:REP element-mobilizing transposase RayT
MILNEYGKIAYNEWLKTPNIRSNIQLDVFIVMPNHIHGIIVITDNAAGRGVLHTPNDYDNTPINMDNKGNMVNKGVCNTPLRSPSNTVGAIIRGYKSAVTKQMHELGFFDAIWQRNYYEHIIRNEPEYQNISSYIICNPETGRMINSIIRKKKSIKKQGLQNTKVTAGRCPVLLISGFQALGFSLHAQSAVETHRRASLLRHPLSSLSTTELGLRQPTLSS